MRFPPLSLTYFFLRIILVRTQQFDCIYDPVLLPPISPVQARGNIKGYLPEAINVNYQSENSEFILRTINSTLQDENGMIENIIQELAKTSGSELSDLFRLEEDQSITLIIPFTSFAASVPGLFGDQTVTGREIIIRNFETFLQTFNIQALSDVVLSIYVELGDFPMDITINYPAGVITTIEFERVEGFKMKLDLLAAAYFDDVTHQDLTFGHFLDENFSVATFATNCAQNLFYEDGLSVINLELQVDEISEADIFTDSFNPITMTVAQVGQFLLNDALQGGDSFAQLGQNCIRPGINSYLANRDGCPEQGNTGRLLKPQNQLFSFKDAQGSGLLSEALDRLRGNGDYAFLNEVIKNVTTGTIYDEEPLGIQNFPMIFKTVNFGELTLLIRNLKSTGLDTVSALSILEPVGESKYLTQNGIELNGPVQLIFDFEIKANDLFLNDPEHVNELRIELNFTEITMSFQTYMELNIPEFLQVKLGTLLYWNRLPCAFEPLEAIEAVQNFSFNIENLYYRITCIGTCESPIILEALEETGAITNTDPGGTANFVDEGLSELVDILFTTNYLDALEKSLDISAKTCDRILPGSTNLLDLTAEEIANVSIVMALIFFILLIICGMASYLLIPIHQRRKAERLRNAGKGKVELVELQSYSMFQHPSIPRSMKYFLPFCCFIGLMLLIIAVFFSDAIHVVLILTLLGGETTNINVLEITGIDSVNKMWYGGAKLFAFGYFSGIVIFPVLELSAIFFLWFAPTTIISGSRREKALRTIDNFGKTSLLGSFALHLITVALQNNLTLAMNAELSDVDEEFLAAVIGATPQRGMVLLVLLLCFTLIINAAFQHYNDKAKSHNLKFEDALHFDREVVPKEVVKVDMLSTYEFGYTNAPSQGEKSPDLVTRQSIFFNTETTSRIISSRALSVFIGMILSTSLLQIIGIFLPLMTFELTGLVGVLTEFLQKDATKTTVSVITLGMAMEQSPVDTFGETFAVLFFQALYFLTTVISPMVQTPVMILMLTRPMTLPQMNRWLRRGRVLYIWASLDVLLVALAVFVIQVNPITDILVDVITDGVCAKIADTLEELVPDSEGKCVSVVAFIEPIGVLVFLGTFGQYICVVMTLMISSVVVEDRYFKAYNNLRRDVFPEKYGRLKRLVYYLLTVEKNKKVGKESFGSTMPYGMAQTKGINMTPFYDNIGRVEANRNAVKYADGADDSWANNMKSELRRTRDKANKKMKPVGKENQHKMSANIFKRGDVSQQSSNPRYEFNYR